MHRLLQKYYSLRQEYWTHVLTPAIYFIMCLILYGSVYQHFYPISRMNFINCYFYGLNLYILTCFIAFLSTIVNFINNNKLQNKFLLKNKFYGTIWHLGNILSLLYITSAVLFIPNYLF